MARRRHESLIPLSHDHREALGLAFRLHNPAPPGPVTPMTPESTPASRAREVIAFFAGHLEAHFRAEEEALFPFLEARLDGEDPMRALMCRLRSEHRRFAELRDEIASSLSAGRSVEAALAEFADLLETHVRAEERELFARFPEDLSSEETTPLAAAVLAELGREPPGS